MASEGIGLGAAVGNDENPLGAIPGGVGSVSSGNATMLGSGPSDGVPLVAEAPIMPRNRFASHDLNRLYPPIVAPADGRMGNYVDDCTDGVLQSGLRIAEGIRRVMTSRGRTRWRDDQSVGLIGWFGPSGPTHIEDVLIGEYGPCKPTADPHREQAYW